MTEYKYIQMTYEQWEEQFKPIRNNLAEGAPFDGTMFETYGKEYEALKKYDINCVWTPRQSDDGEDLIITAGFGWVNRLGYFITTKPWDENTEYDIVA